MAHVEVKADARAMLGAGRVLQDSDFAVIVDNVCDDLHYAPTFELRAELISDARRAYNDARESV